MEAYLVVRPPLGNTLASYLDNMQFAVELFKLEKFPDEEVSVTVSHLCVGNVDHVVIDVEVKLEQCNIQLVLVRLIEFGSLTRI